MFLFNIPSLSYTTTTVGEETWNKGAGQDATAFRWLEFTRHSFDDATLSIIGSDGLGRLCTVN